MKYLQKNDHSKITESLNEWLAYLIGVYKKNYSDDILEEIKKVCEEQEQNHKERASIVMREEREQSVIHLLPDLHSRGRSIK